MGVGGQLELRWGARGRGPLGWSLGTPERVEWAQVGGAAGAASRAGWVEAGKFAQGAASKGTDIARLRGWW